MTILVISGFYPEPNPDNRLYYEKIVPKALVPAVLAAMNYASINDVPMGENDLTQEQAVAVMTLLNDPINNDLMYCIGLCS